jgi:hypothetical protein
VTEFQLLSERVERVSFGFGLTTASLALQQDYVINQSREDRFQISGFKPSGRNAMGIARSQIAAGRLPMESMLSKVFQVADLPTIHGVFVARL